MLESPYYVTSVHTCGTISGFPKFNRILYTIPSGTLNSMARVEWLYYTILTFLISRRIFKFARLTFSKLRQKRMIDNNSNVYFRLHMKITFHFLHYIQKYAGERDGNRNYYLRLRFGEIGSFRESIQSILDYYPASVQTILRKNLFSHRGHLSFHSIADENSNYNSFKQYCTFLSLIGFKL